MFFGRKVRQTPTSLFWHCFLGTFDMPIHHRPVHGPIATFLRAQSAKRLAMMRVRLVLEAVKIIIIDVSRVVLKVRNVTWVFMVFVMFSLALVKRPEHFFFFLLLFLNRFW